MRGHTGPVELPVLGDLEDFVKLMLSVRSKMCLKVVGWN